MADPSHPDTIVISMNGTCRLYVLAPPRGDIKVVPADHYERLAAVVRAATSLAGVTDNDAFWDALDNLTPDDIEAVVQP